MQVVFSELAERDLEEIGDYIAADSPSRAVSFVREVREHCTRIGRSPFPTLLGQTLPRAFAAVRTAAI
jgi:plasmid stabilization system protein ParE